MVDAAKGKKGAAPPPRLVFAWWCAQYRALPGQGGLGEQDYREMYINDVLPRIYDAVQYWRTHGGFGMSAGDKAIMGWIVKMGITR